MQIFKTKQAAWMFLIFISVIAGQFGLYFYKKCGSSVFYGCVIGIFLAILIGKIYRSAKQKASN